MTPDDIIRLARDAGLEHVKERICYDGHGAFRIEHDGWAEKVERFARLVAAAERDRWTLKLWDEISHVQLNNQRLEPQFGQRRGPLAVRVESLLAVIDAMRETK